MSLSVSAPPRGFGWAALKAADFKLYLTIPHKAWAKPWNADAREVGSGERAFEYVARYVQKTALDASRITAVDKDSVSFRWTDRESGNERITRLSGEEFLRRFLQHVLPRGFTRVRHFGWLSPAAKERYARVRGLLRAGEVVLLRPEKVEVCCPDCGHAMSREPEEGARQTATKELPRRGEGGVRRRLNQLPHALRPRARPPPPTTSFAINP